MSDYIKREDAIRVLSDGYAEGIAYAKEIERLPSADVVEREKYEELKKRFIDSVENFDELAKELQNIYEQEHERELYQQQLF